MNDSQTAHPQAAPIIAVTDLVKQFGRFAALRGVSASFEAARLYGILGDNGAGKTTLLRMLAGLVAPTRGQITILGKHNPRDVCREFGYMAHPSLLYDEMSGMENLRYFARLYGLQDQKRCAEIIAAVGLDPELQRPVGQYSQGMRQRMSLGARFAERSQNPAARRALLQRRYPLRARNGQAARPHARCGQDHFRRHPPGIAAGRHGQRVYLDGLPGKSSTARPT